MQKSERTETYTYQSNLGSSLLQAPGRQHHASISHHDLDATGTGTRLVIYLFQVQPLRSHIYQLPVRSSFVTSGSAVHNSYQLKADIALTDPERLNKVSQLSRGSFAASVWGRIQAGHTWCLSTAVHRKNDSCCKIAGALTVGPTHLM